MDDRGDELSEHLRTGRELRPGAETLAIPARCPVVATPHWRAVVMFTLLVTLAAGTAALPKLRSRLCRALIWPERT